MMSAGKIYSQIKALVPPADRVSVGGLLLLTICFTVFMLCGYYYVDDWIYLRSKGASSNQFWECSAGTSVGLKETLTACVDHYCHTNGRLSDKLLILIHELPAWIGRLICGAAFGLMCMQISRIVYGGHWRSYPLGIALLLITIGFFLPWSEDFISVSVGFNYLLASALVFTYCRWYLYSPPTGKYSYALALLLSLAAGDMHEGMSMPVLAGVLCSVLLGRRPTARQWWLTVAFAVGFLVLVLSPATGSRAQRALWLFTDVRWTAKFVSRILSIWPLVIVGVWYIATGRYRTDAHTTHGRVLRYLLLTSLAGLMMVVVIGNHGRPTWYVELCMCMSVCMMLPLRRCAGRVWAMVLFAGMAAWLLLAARCQYGYSRQFANVASQVRSTHSLIVFADNDVYTHTPPILMQLPEPIMSHCYINSFDFNLVALKSSLLSHEPGVCVIPLQESLRSLHYTQWPKVGEDVYGIFPIYYAPHIDGSEDDISMQVTYDISEAPLTLWNLKNKLFAPDTETVAQVMHVIEVPTAGVDRETALQFADERGDVPTSLTFIYVCHIPRRLQYAPILQVQ